MSAIELFESSKPQRYERLRSILRRRTSRNRHRIQDYVSRLERELDTARKLNIEQAKMIEQLYTELSSAKEATWNAIDHAKELERKLQVAVGANEANAHAVDFYFADRPEEPMEQVTHPVPMVRLLDEPMLLPMVNPDPAIAAMERAIADAGDAATVMIDRITTTTKREGRNIADTVVMRRINEEDTHRSPLRPMTAPMSTTGTFRLTKVSTSTFASTDPAGPTKVII